MFSSAAVFVGDISSWNTAAVIDMGGMFAFALVFNGNISAWNVSNVTNMASMFNSAPIFNQNLSAWDVGNVLSMGNMFTSTAAYNTINYDALLIGWSALTLQSNVTFNMNLTTEFTEGAAATGRGVLTSAPNNWTITDGGQVVELIITENGDNLTTESGDFLETE